MTTTITPSSLEQTDPITPVVPVDTTNYQSVITDAISSIPKATEQVNNAQASQDSAITSYLDTLQNQPSATDTTNAEYARNNVQALQDASAKSTAELNRLSAQGDVLARQAQIIPLDIQQKATGQGVTDRGVAPLQAGALRENAIKALTIAQQADIVRATATNDQNALLNAKTKADKIIELTFKDQEQKINTAKANLDLITTYKLTPAQQKLADAKKVQLEYAQEQLKTQKENQKSISDMVVNASASGLGNVDGGADKLSRASKAKTPAEAAMILGEYAGDYYKTQLIKAQISKEQADSIKTQIENGTYNPKTAPTIESGYTFEDYKNGITATESGGDYSAKGPVTSKGDRAYGRYQVMGSNIAEWTKQALGKSVSIQEYLSNPSIQDAVFKDQSERNYKKYGNWDDVASVWFSGRPLAGNTSSDGYNTVPEYVAKVRAGMGYQAPAGQTTSKYDTIAQDILSGGSKIENYDAKDRPKIIEAKNRLQQATVGQITPQLQPLADKLKVLESITNNPYLKTAVGTNTLGRISFSNFATGGKDNFLADVSNILDTQVLDTLISAKSNGATFGALSEGELNLLKNSSSKLSKLAIIKDGQVIGFRGSEANFKQAIEDLKVKTKSALQNAGVTDTNPADSFVDNFDKVLTNGSTPSLSSYASQFNR